MKTVANFIFILFLSVAHICSHAQSNKEITLLNGQDLESPSKSALIELNTLENIDGYFATKLDPSKESLYLEKFDRSLKFQKRQYLAYEDPTHKGIYDYPKIIFLKNNIYLFSPYYDKSKSSYYVTVHTINPDNLAINPVSNIVEFNCKGKDDVAQFLVSKSPDNKFIAFYYLRFPDKDKLRKGEIIVMDHNLKQVWSKNIQYNLNDYSRFTVKDVFVNNNGKVFLHLWNPASKIMAFEPNQENVEEYTLSKYMDDGTSLPLQEYQNTYNLTVANNGDLIYTGVFVQTKPLDKPSEIIRTAYTADGIFYIRIGTNGELKTKLFKDFKSNFYIEKVEEKHLPRIPNSSTVAPNYRSQVRMAKDSSFLIVYELVEEIQHYKYNSSFNVYDPAGKTYRYKDAFVMKVNSKDEFEGGCSVYKNQISDNPFGYFSSCMALDHGKNIYLLYNDRAENNTSSSERIPWKFNDDNSELVLNELSFTGSGIKKSLLKYERGIKYITPVKTIYIDKASFLLFYDKKDLHQFIKLTLN